MSPRPHAAPLALWTTLPLIWALAAPVRADPVDPVSEPVDPRGVGTTVATLMLDLALLDPGISQRDYDFGLGASLQIVAGRERWWPIMIGLGGGVLLFGGEMVTSDIDDDGRRHFGSTTTLRRSTEVRHAELILRVQPWWGVARPYAEAALGLAALWHAERLDDFVSGENIVNNDRQRDFGLLFGFALGVDWRLHTIERGGTRKDLILTAALRRWYAGPMDRPRFGVDDEGTVRERREHAWLGMWVPFVGLALALDNR